MQFKLDASVHPFQAFSTPKMKAKKPKELHQKQLFQPLLKCKNLQKNGFPREMDEKAFLLYNFLLYCVLYSYSLRD